MASASAFVRRSSGEQAALYIRQLIFDGELRPGDRIPQDHIADALGMSRIPVREALIKLSEAGLVRVLPQRGTQVVKISRAAVEDARFIRQAAFQKTQP